MASLYQAEAQAVPSGLINLRDRLLDLQQHLQCSGELIFVDGMGAPILCSIVFT